MRTNRNTVYNETEINTGKDRQDIRKDSYKQEAGYCFRRKRGN